MPAPSVRSCEVTLATRVYWQVPAVTLQMFVQQSKSVVQSAFGGPQQPQVCGAGPDTRHWELVPSGVRHGVGVHAPGPCAQGSHGAGHCCGSQIKPLGQSLLAEH